jgi:hypothetical protein
LLLALVLALGSRAAAAQTPRFYPDDPLRREPAPLPVEHAQARTFSNILETVSNMKGMRGETHPATGVIPAGGVNSLDEVMDGAWYVNRHGTSRMTPEQLRRGAGDANPPSLDAPLRVIVTKAYGARTGLIVADGRNQIYLLTFDPPGYPGLATGADIVTSRFYYALGYHVPENYIVQFTRDRLRAAEGGEAVSMGGRVRSLAESDIDDFLQTVATGPGGVYQASAARLAGRGKNALGPYQLFGLRSDDPNDVVPHEHRRDLRGQFVFAAWLNDSTRRAGNTIDMLVDEGGVPQIRHMLIDFTSALGGGALGGPKRVWEGRQQLYPGLGTIGRNLIGFGLYTPDWMKASYPDLPAAGHLDAETFDPERWEMGTQIPPFANRLPDDTFWAARQVMAFTDEDIAAIVSTGGYDEKTQAWIVRALVERRNRIGRTYLTRVLPLDRFRVENGVLVFDDLATRYRLRPARSYSVRWLAFDNRANQLGAPLAAEGASLPPALRTAVAGTYFAATIAGDEPGTTVTVFVRTGNGGRVDVVGVERLWPGKVVVNRKAIQRGPSRYPDLAPAQRALFERYAESRQAVTGARSTSQVVFDEMSLSEQTTFDAVTQALMKTSLTDQTGASLGTALDLVTGVQRIAGEYAGRGGDQQFRLYVELTDTARETLKKCREFFLDHHNTVYHTGYPESYRLSGKEPNLQVSIAEDGRRADIDVDYRSSRSPRSLFNGHLTAANSDVRVGENPRAHNGRWPGFLEWWRGGLGAIEDRMPAQQDKLGTDVIPTPLPADRPSGIAPEKIEDAVQEFLTDWLVRRQYDQAMEFVSMRAYACMTGERSPDRLDASGARAAMRELMEYSIRELGRRRSLTDAVTAFTPRDASRVVMAHNFSREFLLTPLTAAEARQYECGQTAAGSSSTEYYGAAFYFNKEGSGPLGLLWSRENGTWKIVSYQTISP